MSGNYRMTRLLFWGLFFVWLQALLFAEDACSQKAIRIGIIPFQYESGELEQAEHERLESQFPDGLREALNRSRTVDFIAEIIPDSVLKKAASGIADADAIKGLVSVDVLTKLKEIRPQKYDYYLQGIIWEHNTIVHSLCIVLNSASLKESYEISVDAALRGPSTGRPYDVLDTLIKKTFDILLIKFAKNIRIAVLGFEMTGGDSTRFELFERSLPTMLASGLSVSSRLELLETGKADTLLHQILKTEAASGIYNYATALKLGARLHANYLVMGEFWELNERMRIDVRCVNIESGEITVTKGINIEEINLDVITKKMERLADDLRSAIEMDFINRGKRPLSIAVTGFPPMPHTSDNYILLANLIKTASRKLKIVSGIHVKENSSMVDEFLKRRHDRWEMSFELNADILLSFQLDRTDPENVIIDMDLFDARNPEEFLYNDTKTVSFNKINDAIGGIVDTVVIELMKKKNIDIDDTDREKIRSVEYQGLYQRYGLDFRVGGIYRNDTELFLGYQGGFVFEFNFLWLPFTSSKLQVEPFGFKFDVLNWNKKQRVCGIDYLCAVKYKIRPYSALNPFVGIGFGILGADRIGPSDWMLDGGIGFTALAGVENYIGSSWHMNYELMWSGAPKLETKMIGGSQFKGGRLGGLHFTVGIGHNW